MKTTICRLLIALMLWAPYHAATAGMIGTGQAAATSAERADVARVLEALGIDAALAQQRAAALTDEEARTLASEIRNAPAGGVYGEGILLILLVVAVIYAWYKHYNPY